jgi:hypothetical protein
MGIHDTLRMDEIRQNPIEEIPSDSTLPKRAHCDDLRVAVRENPDSTAQRDDIGWRPP